jgi:hypothetical protein
LFISRTKPRSEPPTPEASAIAASFPDWASSPLSRSRTFMRSPGISPTTDSAGDGRYDDVRNVAPSLARSSVSSAVISFVVEAIGRRDSGARAQAIEPVETSMTIALGAVTSAGHAGGASAARAEDVASSATTTARRTAAARGRGDVTCGA